MFPGVHTTLKSDDPETQRAWIITPVQGDFIQLPEIAEEREMIAKAPTSCYNSSLGRSAQCGGLSRGLVAGPCMSSRSTDFELVVGVVATRDDAIKRYLVQVFSPAGVGSAEIALDPTDPSFANPVSAASGEGPNLDGRKAAGELLFERLFLDKEVKKLWDQSIGQLRAGGFDILRVRLWIADPVLSNLPWELLTWEGSYLATRPDITVSRYLPGPEPAYLEPVERVQVLVVVSRPSKGNLQKIPDDVPSRFKTMFEELKPTIEWTLVENPDLPRLQTEISKGCHILHYLGHGEPNHLILTKPEGDPMPVHVASLGQLVAGRRSLRMVLLNACGSSQSSSADLFSGVGPGLIHLGVPAVVAMQYSHAESRALHHVQQNPLPEAVPW